MAVKTLLPQRQQPHDHVVTPRPRPPALAPVPDPGRTTSISRPCPRACLAAETPAAKRDSRPAQPQPADRAGAVPAQADAVPGGLPDGFIATTRLDLAPFCNRDH